MGLLVFFASKQQFFCQFLTCGFKVIDFRLSCLSQGIANLTCTQRFIGCRRRNEFVLLQNKLPVVWDKSMVAERAEQNSNLSVAMSLNWHGQLALEQVLDVTDWRLFAEHFISSDEIGNKVQLLLGEVSQADRLTFQSLSRIEQGVHTRKVLSPEFVIREEYLNKIMTLFKKFLDSAHVHEVKPDVGIIQPYGRKMEGDEIIHIAEVGFPALKEITLVLLISSTTQLPEFVLWQHILRFLCTATIAWTQKERARSCSLTVSLYFLC